MIWIFDNDVRRKQRGGAIGNKGIRMCQRGGIIGTFNCTLLSD